MNLINFKILETLLFKKTTNRLPDIKNLKFKELFNVPKFKEYKNHFPYFLLRLPVLYA